MKNNQSIDFKEFVKLVHPDVNPNVKDAGSKMKLIIRHRKDSKRLTELAIRWGFLPNPHKPKPRPVQPKTNPNPNSWDARYTKPKPRTKAKPRQTPKRWDTRKVRTGTKPRPIRPKQTVLKSNTLYSNGTEGYHSKFNTWYSVNKTTAKMVYYWDAQTLTTRKCSLNTMYLSRKR